MRISAFFKSRKKSIRIVRVVLYMILLVMAGRLIRQGFNWHIDNSTRKYLEHFDKETQKYINRPIIKKEVLPTFEKSEAYEIINDTYRVKCWIDHYVPYRQEIDTSFYVFNKAGKQLCGKRNSRMLTEYFREQFEW